MSRFVIPFWMILLLCLPAARAEIPPPPRPPGPSMPEVVRFQLPNGLSVLLVPSHANPYVEARFVVRAGSSIDPPGKEGLATLAAAMVIGMALHSCLPKRETQ